MKGRCERLSLNTATIHEWTLEQCARGCVEAGIAAIAPWRDRVDELGVARAANLIREAGLRVSSLCRGGFITGLDNADAIADNRRAIEQAATLGAAVLALVPGGLPEGSRDLRSARGRFAEALAALVPDARAAGVRLAIEPLHPMYCADRAVIVTLAQALELASPYPPEEVGVVLDTFHVWWDPAIWRQIRIAGESGRLALVQAADLALPMPADALLARAHIGDGPVEVAALVAACVEAGYGGDVEVEIFNADVWSTPGKRTLATVVERWQEHLAGAVERAEAVSRTGDRQA